MVVAEATAKVVDVVAVAAEEEAMVMIEMIATTETTAKTKVRAVVEDAEPDVITMVRDVVDTKVLAAKAEAVAEETALKQLVKMAKQLLMELKPVATDLDTRAKLAKMLIQWTENLELAVEREMIADKVLVEVGAKTKTRNQMLKMAMKRSRSIQPCQVTLTRSQTIVREDNAARRRPKLRRKSLKRKLDSLLMTTKLKGRSRTCHRLRAESTLK